MELYIPPKSHNFVSLPLQTGIFSFAFNIKSILNKCKENFPVFLLTTVIALGYKLPLRFILNQLDLLNYYPLFNVMFALLSVMAIANLKGNKITKVMIITGGVLGFVIPYLIPYVNYYFSPIIGHIWDGFASIALLFSLDIWAPKQPIGGYLILNSNSQPSGSLTGSSGNSSVSGSTSSSSGGNGGGDNWRPTKDNPQSKLGGGKGVYMKVEPLTLRDTHGRPLATPAQYTGAGPVDREFGRAMSRSLHVRATIHLVGGTRHSSAVSANWFYPNQWNWLRSHLQSEHNRLVNQAAANGRPAPTTLWNKLQAHSLHNTQELRNSLSSI